MNVLLVYIRLWKNCWFCWEGEKKRDETKCTCSLQHFSASTGQVSTCTDAGGGQRPPAPPLEGTRHFFSLFLSTLLLFFRIPVGDSFLSSPLDTHSSVVDWSRTNKKKRKSWSIKNKNLYAPSGTSFPRMSCTFLD